MKRSKRIKKLIENDDWTGLSEAVRRHRVGFEFLHHATRLGRAGCARVLLDEAGVPADAPCRSRRMSPLTHAVFVDQPRCVGLLLRRGASVDVPLEECVKNGAFRVMLEILSFVESSLHSAVLVRDESEVNRLLETNDPNVKTRGGFTALHMCAMFGSNVGIVQALLGAGADPTVADDKRRTPLHHCCERGYTLVARMLLDRMTFLNARDAFHRTALFCCCLGSPQLVPTLLEAGASANCINSAGVCMLCVCAKLNHVDCLKALLAKGAYVDGGRFYPLTAAASSGNFGCVDELMKFGADLFHNDGEPLVHVSNFVRWRCSEAINLVAAESFKLKTELEGLESGTSPIAVAGSKASMFRLCDAGLAMSQATGELAIGALENFRSALVELRSPIAEPAADELGLDLPPSTKREVRSLILRRAIGARRELVDRWETLAIAAARYSSASVEMGGPSPETMVFIVEIKKRLTALQNIHDLFNTVI